MKKSSVAVNRQQLSAFDERPQGVTLDTIVIHCMYDSHSPLPYDLQACLAVLERERVSAHYAVARDGEIWALVDEEKRAWHAGESCMPFEGDKRTALNDFSIGIELIGSPHEQFAAPQYSALARLLADILERHDIHFVIGHQHVAPARKIDPGPHFDWRLLEQEVKALLLAQSKPERFSHLTIWR